MRTTITILGLFGGMILFEQAYILSRVGQLLTGQAWDLLIAGPVVLFGCWVLATGLVLHFPGAAAQMFALGSVAGIFAGFLIEMRVVVAWGVAAGVFAIASMVAQREQRAAVQRERDHDRHLIAISTALIDVRETVAALNGSGGLHSARLETPALELAPGPAPGPAPVLLFGERVEAR